MTHRGDSLGRLYVVGGIVGLLGIAYGVLDVRPNPAMGLCLGTAGGLPFDSMASRWPRRLACAGGSCCTC
jgi:hypothetical protein